MDKSKFRQLVKERVTLMSEDRYSNVSRLICQKALQEHCIQRAEIIAVTISNRPEVDTLAFIEELWRLGKQVAVPKCNAKTREMDFYVFTDYNQLETVYMHLQEPIPTLTKRVSANEIDVIIVPGVAFDKRGYRVGYGGGYYDRYLSFYKGALVAFVFDEQLFTQVPFEDHDIPVHRIITQSTEIDCFLNRKGQ